jgi:hypothetical protein
VIAYRPLFVAQFAMGFKPFLQVTGAANINFILLFRMKYVNSKHVSLLKTKKAQLLLSNRAFLMIVAGAGFEPATFGL